jgi:hypothetical protein
MRHAAFTFVLLAVPLAAAEEKRPRAALLVPGGGVAGPDAVGYFPAADGGVEAIDLGTGETRWKTDQARRPLLATADRLFARADVPGARNKFRVVVFDVKGKRFLASEPLELPAWVSVQPESGRSFVAAAYLEKDRLFLVWEARGWYALGRRPTPAEERAARRLAVGAARVDLRSGKVMVLPEKELPAGVPRTPPAGPRSLTVAGRSFTFIDRPAGSPFLLRRWLRSTDAAGKLLWEHEVAPPPFLPPKR